MRSFVFVYILAVLGAIVFLTVQYSFWVACVITYIFTMLVVAVNAYVGGSRPSWKSNSKVLKDKAYNAQAGVHNERLQLVEKYQKCVKAAGSDNVKVEECYHYLKAAEALK